MSLAVASYSVQVETWAVSHNHTHCRLQCRNGQVQECQVQHMGNVIVSVFLIV